MSGLIPEVLRTRGGCWRCNLTPPGKYMEQPPCSSSLSSDCLTSDTLLKDQPPTSVLTTAPPSAAAMEESYSCPLQLQENEFLFDSLLEKSYNPVPCDPASDPGYFSSCSSLSPTSSVDSFCFSPTSLQTAVLEQDALESFIFNSPAAALPTTETPCPRSPTTASTSKKSRSRYPGKKRQTASEREKLRMRDLTKALHHLRTYLPPSVAPAGQTLTKIDTLRLTIRYISYLSDRLGLSEEALQQRRASGFAQLPQTLHQFLGQPTVSYSLQESSGNMANTAQLSPLQQLYQVGSHRPHKSWVRALPAPCYLLHRLPAQYISNKFLFRVIRCQAKFASAASSVGYHSKQPTASASLDIAEGHGSQSHKLFSLQQ